MLLWPTGNSFREPAPAISYICSQANTLPQVMQTCPSPQQCHSFTPIFLSLITPSWNKLATPTIGILLLKIVLLDASPLLMCQMNLQADGAKANQQIQINILMFLQILSGPLIWKAPSSQFMFYTIFLKCPTEYLQVKSLNFKKLCIY